VASFYQHCDEVALKYITLGCSADVDWEQLPRDIRELIVKRTTGREEPLSKAQQDWLSFNRSPDIPVRSFVARCNFGAYVALSNRKYAFGARITAESNKAPQSSLHPLPFLNKSRSNRHFTSSSVLQRLKYPFSIVYHNTGVGLKLLALAFVAEPELQRELNYALQTTPSIIRNTVMFLITGIWVYTMTLQKLLLPVFLFHGRDNIKTLWGRIGGTTITMLKRQRILIESNDGTSTAFIHAPYGLAGTFKVHQYAGTLDREPADKMSLQRVSIYSKGMMLMRREDYSNGNKTNVYKYEYLTDPEKTSRRFLTKARTNRYPALRKCIEGNNKSEEHVYNQYGLVEMGSYILHGSLVRFSCHYRQESNFEDELLRAEFALPHMTCTVAWSAPPTHHPEKLETWIPSSQVMEATFVLGSDVYESRWIYDHKFHPTILTTLNGDPIETPPIIQFDHLGLVHSYPIINELSILIQLHMQGTEEAKQV